MWANWRDRRTHSCTAARAHARNAHGNRMQLKRGRANELYTRTHRLPKCYAHSGTNVTPGNLRLFFTRHSGRTAPGLTRKECSCARDAALCRLHKLHSATTAPQRNPPGQQGLAHAVGGHSQTRATQQGGLHCNPCATAPHHDPSQSWYGNNSATLDALREPRARQLLKPFTTVITSTANGHPTESWACQTCHVPSKVGPDQCQHGGTAS